MATMNMIEAINSAMDVALSQDPNVTVLGEDIGYFGGVFRATAGLQKKHGKTRVFDTPINECGIIGVAVGMAAYGLRPIPEIQFADYIYPGLDQLVSEAARSARICSRCSTRCQGNSSNTSSNIVSKL